MHILLLNILML